MTQAELGRNQIYEFQPNPEVEQRVFPLKSNLAPKEGKDSLPSTIFQGQAVNLRLGV